MPWKVDVIKSIHQISEEEQDPFKAVIDCVDHENGREGDQELESVLENGNWKTENSSRQRN